MTSDSHRGNGDGDAAQSWNSRRHFLGVDGIIVWLPQVAFEINAEFLNESHSLFFKQRAHDGWMAPGPTASQLPIAVDDTVGDRCNIWWRLVQEPADHPRGASCASRTCDTAVGRYSTWRNAADDSVNSFRERRVAFGRPMVTSGHRFRCDLRREGCHSQSALSPATPEGGVVRAKARLPR